MDNTEAKQNAPTEEVANTNQRKNINQTKNASQRGGKQGGSKEDQRALNSSWRILPPDLTKQIYLILGVFSMVVGTIILGMGFFPAAKIGGMSLGSHYTNAIDILKYWLLNVDILGIKYDHSLTWGAAITNLYMVSLICLIFGICIFCNGIAMMYRLTKKNEECLVDTDLGIFGSVIRAIIETVFLVSAFSQLRMYESLFLVKYSGQRIMLIIATFYVLVCPLIKIVTAKKGNRISDSKAIKMVHTKQTHKSIPLKMPAFNLFLLLLLTLGTVSSIYSENFYTFINRSELTNIKYAHAPLEQSLCGEKLKVGEEAPKDEYIIRFHDVDIISVNYSENDEWSIKWDLNKYFYDQLIEQKREEINSLMPEKVGSDATLEEAEKSLEEYLAKVAALEKELELLYETSQRLPVPVESYKRDPKTNIITEHVFNTNRIDKSQHPYGNTDTTLLSLGKESIVVYDSIFGLGTDFSREKIIVTVTYKDGSVKTSMITPSNSNELNQASSGIHYIKWSDEWGEYSAQISIQ